MDVTQPLDVGREAPAICNDEIVWLFLLYHQASNPMPVFLFLRVIRLYWQYREHCEDNDKHSKPNRCRVSRMLEDLCYGEWHGM